MQTKTFMLSMPPIQVRQTGKQMLHRRMAGIRKTWMVGKCSKCLRIAVHWIRSRMVRITMVAGLGTAKRIAVSRATSRLKVWSMWLPQLMQSMLIIFSKTRIKGRTRWSTLEAPWWATAWLRRPKCRWPMEGNCSSLSPASLRLVAIR